MIVAIVPGAGLSERMGRPKLLLPIDGIPLIARVIRALRAGGADRVVVVGPPAERAWSGPLADAAEAEGAQLILPREQPADMRASVELGLAGIVIDDDPEVVLLTPGDAPGLGAGLVTRVIDASRQHPGQIVVPVYGGRRGHPLALPWTLAASIPQLPAGVGINALVADHAAEFVPVEAGPEALVDLDTPEDLRRWQARGR